MTSFFLNAIGPQVWVDRLCYDIPVLVSTMDSTSDALKNTELEEGELEDDNNSEDNFQVSRENGKNSSSFNCSERAQPKGKGWLGTDAGVIRTVYEISAASLGVSSPEKRADHSFWGPVDLFEKHKQFEKKFTWFNRSQNRRDVSYYGDVKQPLTESSKTVHKSAPLQRCLKRSTMICILIKHVS